tara:strand:+ start:92 stop:310 length:219 start_codon:yes stop_codon:yes gene_type:complete
MNYLLLENNHFYFKIHKNITETNSEFREKCNYIISKNPNNIEEFNTLCILGEIRNNVIFYNAKYSKNILDKL